MSTVQVILLQDIVKLGQLGDVVKVRRGHARNHLLPTGKVQTYTEEAWAGFKEKKQEIIRKQKDSRAALEQQHADLDGYLLQSVMQASDEGQLYGSVTQSVIVDMLRKQNQMLKRNQIALPNNEPIKRIGEYEIKLTISENLIATLKFSVLSEK